MIITCESCATQFQLDSSRIPPEGIRVRCSICKHSFFVENHEAESGDPVERAVGRVLAEDEAGIPGVTHDLDGGGVGERAGGRFEQSFEAAREAVDDLLGFSMPRPSASPSEIAEEPEPRLPVDEAGLDDVSPDEDFFPAEEELTAASAPASDPWDTPLPVDGPAEVAADGDDFESAPDPWDASMPVAEVSAPPDAALAENPSDGAPPGGPWEEDGWGPDADEGAPDPDPGAALDEERAWADELEPSAAEEREPDPDSNPEDELDAALALGWGGTTDTAGIELAEAEAPRAEAAGQAAEDDCDLDLEEGPAGGEAAPLATASALRVASPAIGFGARLGVPEGQRILVWLASLGTGVGWSIVAGLAAVLLWASVAPRAATEQPAGPLALSGLEASGVEGHWVENALAGSVLVVSGELRNPGGSERAPGARIVVRLLDAAGAPLDIAPTSAGLPLDRTRLREASPAELRAARDAASQALARAALPPGERTRFEALVLSVPDAATRFELATEPLAAGEPSGS